jgi:methylated-DNA-[protein]-cysteine S-methyltransferase
VSQAQNAGRIELEHQIDEYLAGTRRSFDVRIRPTGTAFQTKVWEYLATIPFGETVTYEFIARQLGTPDAARAVGNAVKANKLLIVIPCHRVVPKSGGIGSFSAGVSVKKSLLEHERRIMEAAFAEGSFRRVR